MDILLSANDNYLLPVSVLMQSVFDCCRERPRFWFLAADLAADNRSFLSDHAYRHEAEIAFIDVDSGIFRHLPARTYISQETYFRLLAADCLPPDIHKVLWLDADMALCGDISDLYDIDLGDQAVAACPHGPAMKSVIGENCAHIGIEWPAQYFNAGMMLCNLDVWRTMDIKTRIQKVLAEPHHFMFPGQDLTNLIFNGSVTTLDWETYNCMTHSVDEENMARLREKARIIHYVGPAKPWKFNDLPFGDIWDSCYEKSPFGKNPLRRLSYFRLKRMQNMVNKTSE